MVNWSTGGSVERNNGLGGGGAKRPHILRLIKPNPHLMRARDESFSLPLLRVGAKKVPTSLPHTHNINLMMPFVHPACVFMQFWASFSALRLN